MASKRLTVEVRKERGSGAAKRLRKQGIVPAVLYGGDSDNIPLSVDAKQLHKVLHGGAGEHAIIDLTIKGAEAGKSLKKTVIVKEVQHDYLKDSILHADFAVISLKEKIMVNIQVVSEGEPEGVTIGGILEHIAREVEVECLPADLPERFVLDVSGLKIGDSLKVADITPPAGVTILADPQITLFTVSPPKVEEVEAPAEEAAEEAAAAEAGEKPGEEKKGEEEEKE